MKDNPCVRFAYYDNLGNKVYKSKRTFSCDKDAIAYAKEMNKRHINTLIHKLVAYKCDKCHMWHVGRSGVELSEKQRSKIKNS